MYLYIVYNKSTKLTKIGITDNFERRFEQLKNACGCDLSLVSWAEFDHAGITEKFLHATFKDQKVKGEWFNLNYFKMSWLSAFWRSYFLGDEDNCKFDFGYLAWHYDGDEETLNMEFNTTEYDFTEDKTPAEKEISQAMSDIFDISKFDMRLTLSENTE